MGFLLFRRRTRFSLRTLLLVIGFIALALGAGTMYFQRESRAISSLRNMGCEVHDLPSNGQSHYIVVVPHGKKIPFHLLRRMRLLSGIQALRADVTDDDLAELELVPQITQLGLGYTSVGDKSMEYIAKLPNLEELDLTRTEITDQGVSALKQLRNLKGLYVMRTKITDAALASIVELPELLVLGLNSTAITDKGLEHLECGHALAVGLDRTKVTKAGVDRLRSKWGEAYVGWSESR